jgi:hypothetical protein
VAYSRSTGKLPFCAFIEQYHDAFAMNETMFALQDIMKNGEEP